MGCFSRCGIYHSFVVQGLRALPGGRKGEPPGGLPVFTRRFSLPFLPLIFTPIFTPDFAGDFPSHFYSRFCQGFLPPIFPGYFPRAFSTRHFPPAYPGSFFTSHFFLCKISTRFIGTGRTPTRPSTNLQKIARSRFLQKVSCCEPKTPLPKSHPRIPPSLIPKNLYPLKGI